MSVVFAEVERNSSTAVVAEVNFVVSQSTVGSSSRMRHLAIEVKTSRRITGNDFSGLRALAEEDLDLKKILVNPHTLSRVTDDGIDVLSVDDFLEELAHLRSRSVQYERAQLRSSHQINVPASTDSSNDFPINDAAKMNDFVTD